MPVAAYILLSKPVDGQFTHLTESQGGEITHSTENQKQPTLAPTKTGHVGFWPQEVQTYGSALKQYEHALNR